MPSQYGAHAVPLLGRPHLRQCGRGYFRSCLARGHAPPCSFIQSTVLRASAQSGGPPISQGTPRSRGGQGRSRRTVDPGSWSHCSARQHAVGSRRNRHKPDPAPLSLCNWNANASRHISDHRNCGQKKPGERRSDGAAVLSHNPTMVDTLQHHTGSISVHNASNAATNLFKTQRSCYHRCSKAVLSHNPTMGVTLRLHTGRISVHMFVNAAEPRPQIVQKRRSRVHGLSTGGKAADTCARTSCASALPSLMIGSHRLWAVLRQARAFGRATKQQIPSCRFSLRDTCLWRGMGGQRLRQKIIQSRLQAGTRPPAVSGEQAAGGPAAIRPVSHAVHNSTRRRAGKPRISPKWARMRQMEGGMATRPVPTRSVGPVGICSGHAHPGVRDVRQETARCSRRDTAQYEGGQAGVRAPHAHRVRYLNKFCKWSTFEALANT